MGDGDDGALVLGQVALEPGHRLGVEVVGGLVEQQQFGRAQEQPTQRHAPALTAGERADIGIRRGQAQRVHREFELGVQVPGVGRFDLGLDRGELVGRVLGVVGRELVEAVEQRLGLGNAVLHVSLDVLGLVELGLLLEHPDGRTGRERGLAAVLLIDAGHDPQQRRLARSVVAQHADLGAGVERQGDVVEDRLVGRMQPGQPVHREDVLRGHSA